MEVNKYETLTYPPASPTNTHTNPDGKFGNFFYYLKVLPAIPAFKYLYTALNPNKFNFSGYYKDLYMSSLCIVSSTLGLVYLKSKLSKDHKTFFNLLFVEANQETFQSY